MARDSRGRFTRSTEDVKRRLNNVAKKLPNLVAAALYQEALIEQKESMRRTPVKTGALRASHETHQPTVENGKVSVTISVGGPAAPYALFVHENLEAHHPVGQAKFLESTLRESAPMMAERVARRINLEEAI